MAWDTYGSPQFGLADVKIATWNATNSYGNAVDVMSAQLLGVSMRVSSAELTGDDTITAVASRAIAGSIRLRFGAVSISALEVLIGNTATSSVASPNTVKQLKISGGDNMPYFGLTGRAVAEEGSGDFLVFIPKCRITGDLNIATLEYGAFAIPEVEAMAVNDETFGIIDLVERQTGSTTVAVPPANIA